MWGGRGRERQAWELPRPPARSGARSRGLKRGLGQAGREEKKRKGSVCGSDKRRSAADWAPQHPEGAPPDEEEEEVRTGEGSREEGPTDPRLVRVSFGVLLCFFNPVDG